MPARTPGNVAGTVRLEGVELQSSQVQLFREPSVDVKIEGARPHEVESPTVEETSALGAVAEVLECGSADAAPAEASPASAAPASAPAQPAESRPSAGSSSAVGGVAQGGVAEGCPTGTNAERRRLATGRPQATTARRTIADARKGKEPSIHLSWRLNHPKVHVDQITRCVVSGTRGTSRPTSESASAKGAGRDPSGGAESVERAVQGPCRLRP